MPLNTHGAQKIRNTLAKVIYSHLFQFIVSNVTKNLVISSKSPSESDTGINILDIAGFGLFNLQSNYLSNLFVTLLLLLLIEYFLGIFYRMLVEESVRTILHQLC